MAAFMETVTRGITRISADPKGDEEWATWSGLHAPSGPACRTVMFNGGGAD